MGCNTHAFLDGFQDILQNPSLVESNGVTFTTFQLQGPAKKWEEMRGQFDHFQQGRMSVTEYEMRFNDLVHYAAFLMPIEVEKLRRFEGLNFGIKISMAREAETGMDWLYPYHAILDCHAKIVILAMQRLPRLEWKGSIGYAFNREVSFLQAQRMVEKGCLAYVAFVRDISNDTPTVESVPLVREFPDVFPVDLTMPPDRDIDFGIDLVLGTHPISIPPYLMAPAELKELKELLQELLDKGFIRPSISPWGADVICEEEG
ncbi:uncharacterized protein [Nicotiana tomentosiformis]|uniref:uncharacterized protein n=1 Tax=Nicotiana tomentosiformis TaxID=4098 RepID=UPI00388CDA48